MDLLKSKRKLQQCIDNAIDSPDKIVVLQCATGLGKSYGIKKLISTRKQFGFIVFVPTIKLANEYKNDLIKVFRIPKQDIKLYKGRNKKTCNNFSRVQSLYRKNIKNINLLECVNCKYRKTCKFHKQGPISKLKQRIIITTHSLFFYANRGNKEHLNLYNEKSRIFILEEDFISEALAPHQIYENEIMSFMDVCNHWLDKNDINTFSIVENLKESTRKLNLELQNAVVQRNAGSEKIKYISPIDNEFNYDIETANDISNRFEYVNDSEVVNQVNAIISGIKYGAITSRFRGRRSTKTTREILKQHLNTKKLIICDATFNNNFFKLREIFYATGRIIVHPIFPKLRNLEVIQYNDKPFSKTFFEVRKKERRIYLGQIEERIKNIYTQHRKLFKNKEILVLTHKSILDDVVNILGEFHKSKTIHKYCFGNCTGTNDARESKVVIKIGSHRFNPVDIYARIIHTKQFTKYYEKHKNDSEVFLKRDTTGKSIYYSKRTGGCLLAQQLSDYFTFATTYQGISRARPLHHNVHHNVTVFDFSDEDYENKYWKEVKFPNSNLKKRQFKVRKEGGRPIDNKMQDFINNVLKRMLKLGNKVTIADLSKELVKESIKFKNKFSNKKSKAWQSYLNTDQTRNRIRKKFAFHKASRKSYYTLKKS